MQTQCGSTACLQLPEGRGHHSGGCQNHFSLSRPSPHPLLTWTVTKPPTLQPLISPSLTQVSQLHPHGGLRSQPYSHPDEAALWTLSCGAGPLATALEQLTFPPPSVLLPALASPCTLTSAGLFPACTSFIPTCVRHDPSSQSVETNRC